MHARRRSFPILAKVAITTGVAAVGMGVLTFAKHQDEMRGSAWIKSIKEKLNDHRGVKVLFGETPVRLGIITRRKPDYEAPSVTVEPAPTHLVTIKVKGDKSKGTLYAWLNKPADKTIETVDDWNLARVELQVGGNREKKMPIS